MIQNWLRPTQIPSHLLTTRANAQEFWACFDGMSWTKPIKLTVCMQIGPTLLRFAGFQVLLRGLGVLLQSIWPDLTWLWEWKLFMCVYLSVRGLRCVCEKELANLNDLYHLQWVFLQFLSVEVEAEGWTMDTLRLIVCLSIAPFQLDLCNCFSFLDFSSQYIPSMYGCR